MKIIELLSREDNRKWLLVSSICVAIIFAMIILFSGRPQKNLKENEIDKEQQNQNTNKMILPVAQTQTPDAVTHPTPRIIAWMNIIVDNAKPSVVGICVGDTVSPPPWQQGWEVVTPSGKRSVGSGVIVNSNGFILTNYHVIEAVGNIVVSLFTGFGKYEEYTAKIVSGYKNKDLALLKINSNTPLPYIATGNSDKVLVGDQVIAIGNPFGLTQTVTTGIISAKRKRLPIGNVVLYNVFQSDVPINPGNSGGALLNLNGELIGISTAILSPTGVYTGISFSIPTKEAMKLFGNYIEMKTTPANFQFVKQTTTFPVQKQQKIQPSPGEGIEELAWLGIDLTPNPTNEPGVEVDEIEGISPMEAGLQAGDIINAVNGKQIKDIYDMKDVIKTVPLKSGSGIVLDVYRPRQKRSLYISFRLKEWDLKGR